MTDLAGPQVLDDVSKALASISCRLWLFYIDCKFYMAFRNWAVLMLKCNMTSRKVRMVFALYWEKPRKAKGASWQAFLRLVLVYNFGLTVERRTNGNWNVWWVRTWTLDVLFKTLLGMWMLFWVSILPVPELWPWNEGIFLRKTYWNIAYETSLCVGREGTVCIFGARR